jgi:hypothetical protein
MSFPFDLVKPLLDYEHMKLYIGILIVLHFSCILSAELHFRWTVTF